MRTYYIERSTGQETSIVQETCFLTLPFGCMLQVTVRAHNTIYGNCIVYTTGLFAWKGRNSRLGGASLLVFSHPTGSCRRTNWKYVAFISSWPIWEHQIELLLHNALACSINFCVVVSWRTALNVLISSLPQVCASKEWRCYLIAKASVCSSRLC